MLREIVPLLVEPCEDPLTCDRRSMRDMRHNPYRHRVQSTPVQIPRVAALVVASDTSDLCVLLDSQLIPTCLIATYVFCVSLATTISAHAPISDSLFTYGEWHSQYWFPRPVEVVLILQVVRRSRLVALWKEYDRCLRTRVLHRESFAATSTISRRVNQPEGAKVNIPTCLVSLERVSCPRVVCIAILL